MVTHLDIVPTLLDWLGLSYPHYHIFKRDGDVRLTGRSLLECLTGNDMKRRVRLACRYFVLSCSMKIHKVICSRMFS